MQSILSRREPSALTIERKGAGLSCAVQPLLISPVEDAELSRVGETLSRSRPHSSSSRTTRGRTTRASRGRCPGSTIRRRLRRTLLVPAVTENGVFFGLVFESAGKRSNSQPSSWSPISPIPRVAVVVFAAVAAVAHGGFLRPFFGIDGGVVADTEVDFRRLLAGASLTGMSVSQTG